MSGFLVVAGSKPPKRVAAAPLTWTKIECGVGDGATTTGSVSAWPAAQGLRMGGSVLNTFSDAGASGGSFRYSNSNNACMFYRNDNCTGFRYWTEYPFGPTSGVAGITLDNDDQGLFATEQQITVNYPHTSSFKVYEVTGLTRGIHTIRVRVVGTGVVSMDYFEYQS